MFADIVMPKDNEFEFINVASRLNIRKLYFVYGFDEYNNERIQKKLDSLRNKNTHIECGFLVNLKNLNDAAKKSDLLIAKSSDKVRLFFENKKIRLIYGIEETYKKDYLHQRASGLNHTMCEIARNNNIAVGFSYSLLLNKDKLQNSILMGRMMQNISLCQKYKVKTIIASFSSRPFDLRLRHDISSLFKILGMNEKQLNDPLNF